MKRKIGKKESTQKSNRDDREINDLKWDSLLIGPFCPDKEGDVVSGQLEISTNLQEVDHTSRRRDLSREIRPCGHDNFHNLLPVSFSLWTVSDFSHHQALSIELQGDTLAKAFLPNKDKIRRQKIPQDRCLCTQQIIHGSA